MKAGKIKNRVRLGIVMLVLLAKGAFAAPAPDFTLVAASGETVQLSQQRGQVVMLNFWASWCGPCRVEMPLLDELYVRYNPVGFQLYGINVEADNSAAKQFIQSLGVSLPVLYDPDSTLSKLYDVSAMPTTVLIDKQGEIRYVNRGYKTGDEEKYRQQIRELIKE